MTDNEDQVIPSLTELRKQILHCCAANGYRELAGKIDVEWSNKIRVPAQAQIGTMTIALSAKILRRLPDALKAEVVSRETCQLIAFALESNTRKYGLWSRLMEKAGYPDADSELKLPKSVEGLVAKSGHKKVKVARKPFEETHKPYDVEAVRSKMALPKK